MAFSATLAETTKPVTTLPDGPGKQLVLDYCTQCHELKRIEEDQGTEAEWITRIRRMTRRGATIPTTQIEPLGKYLARALPPRVRKQSGENSPIATAVAEAVERPIQVWIRGAGALQSDLTTLIANVDTGAAHIELGDRVRAFALSSRSSMYQAKVVAVAKGTANSPVRIQLSRPGLAANERYLFEIVTEQPRLLSIPNEAIIEEGERQIVYVQSSSGDYVPREIKTGLQGELHSQVVSGLQSGEHVVTFGSFFIDAEYKLKAGSPAVVGGESLTIDYRGEPAQPREGDNAVEVTIKQANGAPLTDGDVTVTYSMAAMPSMNMPEMRSDFPLEHRGGGRYTGQAFLSMTGTWQVNIVVAVKGRPIGTKELTVVVK